MAARNRGAIAHHPVSTQPRVGDGSKLAQAFELEQDYDSILTSDYWGELLDRFAGRRARLLAAACPPRRASRKTH